MTLTELRDTLASVSDAVAVPTPDASAFERRVAGVRRRRAAVRVAGVVAAVAVGAGVVLLPGDDTSPPVVTHVEPADVVPVVLDGELALVGPDGATPTGVQVSGLVGQGENGVVTLDPHRHVVVVQLTDDGIGVVRDLSGEPVASVASPPTAGSWCGWTRTVGSTSAAPSTAPGPMRRPAATRSAVCCWRSTARTGCRSRRGG